MSYKTYIYSDNVWKGRRGYEQKRNYLGHSWLFTLDTNINIVFGTADCLDKKQTTILGLGVWSLGHI